MNRSSTNGGIAASLLFVVLLWGGNNAGTKFLVKSWPPTFVGCTRFLLAGALLAFLLRKTGWLGKAHRIDAELNRALWWRAGLALAVYVVAFNWALRFTSVAYVTLYIGTAPIWALVWEQRPELTWKSFQRYGAAGLGLIGVLVLLWPSLKAAESHNLIGQLLALAASLLWTNYGRQCRAFTTKLSGAEITAESFWRGGLLLIPLGALELFTRGVSVTPSLVAVQIFCVIFGGIVAFVLWNNALTHWETSRVYLFINLIPLSSMIWANVCLGEPITRTFWVAMILIVAGVVIGQTNWQKVAGWRWFAE